MFSLRRLLTVVVAVFVAFLPTARATAAPSATDALAKATGYLVTTIGTADHLKSEFGDEGITADAVLALAASGDAAQAPLIKRLTTWLEGKAKAYTAASPEGAAKLALVATATGGSAANFGGVDLPAVITKAIKKDGSFGAYPGPFAQSLGIIALSRAGAEIPASMGTWLLTQQNTDGGFTYEAGKPSDADNTGLAVVALAALNSPESIAGTAKAIAWAQQSQQADGSWAGFNPVNSTAVMAMGQIAAKAEPSSALAYLATQQLASGALPNAGKADLLSTVQGMLPLAGRSYLTVSTAAEPTAPTAASASTTAAPAASATASAAATTAPAPAPGTSNSTLWLLGVAAVVVVLGVGALVLGRRRNRP